MPHRRSFLLAIFALLALTVVFGAPLTRIPLLTEAVLLEMPAALAIPILVPPLWLPGPQPLLMWGIDLLAAAVLIGAAARVMLRRGHGGGAGGPGWVWRRVVLATAVGLVLANVVRTVGWSFYTGPSLTIYAATVGLAALASALVGALLGGVIGGLAALLSPREARV